MDIALIAGVRPNFIKAAALWRAFRQKPDFQVRLVHTGQHSDPAMSEAFFRELHLPQPDIVIKGRSSTPTQELARITKGLEPVLQAYRPHWVVVIGDVTSTLAAALTAKQIGLRVAHVEAGLRSRDRQMPEELNRIATDHLADLLLPSEEAGVENLLNEGISAERIFYAGNVLIDSLAAELTGKAENRAAIQDGIEVIDNGGSGYALFTFHRPSNVDSPDGLNRLLDLAYRTVSHLPVVFPVHPRTARALQKTGLFQQFKQIPGLHIFPPLNYQNMVYALRHARFVITDSGGVQEESTWLGKPCLTFRTTTERPATLAYGTNTLIDDLRPETAEHFIRLILAGQYKAGKIPPRWDGKAAERIAETLATY